MMSMISLRTILNQENQASNVIDQMLLVGEIFKRTG